MWVLAHHFWNALVQISFRWQISNFLQILIAIYNSLEFSLIGRNYVNWIQKSLWNRFIFTSHIENDFASRLISIFRRQYINMLWNFSLKNKNIRSSNCIFPLLIKLIFVSVIVLICTPNDYYRVVSRFWHWKNVGLASVGIFLSDNAWIVDSIFFKIINERLSFLIRTNLPQHLNFETRIVFFLLFFMIQSRYRYCLIGSFASESLENLIFCIQSFSY